MVVSAFNGVYDHPGDAILAEFRTDQHVILVRIVPIAPEIHPDVVGALPIGHSDQTVDVRGSRHPFLDTGDSIPARSVNENMKDVLHVLQHALTSPADDHTISPRIRFGDEVPAARSHGFASKTSRPVTVATPSNAPCQRPLRLARCAERSNIMRAEKRIDRKFEVAGTERAAILYLSTPSCRDVNMDSHPTNDSMSLFLSKLFES